jgi:hypothetical protein
MKTNHIFKLKLEVEDLIKNDVVLDLLNKKDTDEKMMQEYEKYLTSNMNKKIFYATLKEYEKYYKKMHGAKDLEGLKTLGSLAFCCMVFALSAPVYTCQWDARHPMKYSPDFDKIMEQTNVSCPTFFFNRTISDYLAEYVFTIVQFPGSLWFVVKFFNTLHYDYSKRSKEFITSVLAICGFMGVAIIPENYFGKWTMISDYRIHQFFSDVGFGAMILLPLYRLNGKFRTKLKENTIPTLKMYKLPLLVSLGAISSMIWMATEFHFSLTDPKYFGENQSGIQGEWTLAFFLSQMFWEGFVGAYAGMGDNMKALRNKKNILVFLFLNFIPYIIAMTNFLGFGMDNVMKMIFGNIFGEGEYYPKYPII